MPPDVRLSSDPFGHERGPAPAAGAAGPHPGRGVRGRGSGRECSAGDSYDRAARAQHGRLPRRSGDGDQLRRTARMIALAATVAELRQAQQHAAQAAAARAAAAHLHSAMTEAVTGAAFRACTVVADLQGGRSRAPCSP